MAAEGKTTIKQPRLIAIGAGAGPRELPLLRRKITVGSAIGNHFVLSEKTVSRRHAVIRRRLRGFDLIDLESTNGTYVNGVRVAK
ncbi:MAG: FHA domain-containing protein, partial [Candidatus Binataceae bacterium]